MNTNSTLHATSAKPVATPPSNTIELAGFVFERRKELKTEIELELYTEIDTIEAIYSDSFKEALKGIRSIAECEHQAPCLFPYNIYIGVRLKSRNNDKAVLHIHASNSYGSVSAMLSRERVYIPEPAFRKAIIVIKETLTDGAQTLNEAMSGFTVH